MRLVPVRRCDVPPGTAYLSADGPVLVTAPQDGEDLVPMFEPEAHEVIATFAAAGMTAEIISEGAG